jgi:hypothetical protein
MYKPLANNDAKDLSQSEELSDLKGISFELRRVEKHEKVQVDHACKQAQHLQLLFAISDVTKELLELL